MKEGSDRRARLQKPGTIWIQRHLKTGTDLGEPWGDTWETERSAYGSSQAPGCRLEWKLNYTEAFITGGGGGGGGGAGAGADKIREKLVGRCSITCFELLDLIYAHNHYKGCKPRCSFFFY